MISSVNSFAGALLDINYSEVAGWDYTYDFVNTYRIAGGNVLLPLAFYHSFENPYPKQYAHISQTDLGKVDYRNGLYVTGIYQSNYRNKIILKYKNRVENKDYADIFDYVICTIPFSSLRAVEIKPYFSNAKMQAILELNYTNAQKSLFLCNRRFWERNTDYGRIVGGISSTDLIIQSVLYPSDHIISSENQDCSPDEPGVITASYNLNQNASRLGSLENLIHYETVRQNVEEVHGLPRGFLNSFVTEYKNVIWSEETEFKGGFSLNLPGQKQLFAYEMLKPEYNGKIYFAGEHTSVKHGWIQGALSSGMAAANRLAESLH